MKKIITSLIVMFFTSSALVSAAGVGTTGAQFLKIDPSARPMGMGGAYVAVSDDSNAMFYNPAGLASIESMDVSGTFLRYFQGINYGSLAAVMPKCGDLAMGIAVNYLGVTDIPKRSATDVTNPEGTLAAANTFGAMDTAITVGVAKKDLFSEKLDLGVNMRFIYQTIDDESAFAAMLDIGALYDISDKISFGLVFQNLGSSVKFIDEADALPLNIKAGAAIKPINGLSIVLDINEYVIDQMLYVSAGAEYWLKELVAFRAGYKYGYDTDSLGSTVGISGGLGFRYNGMGLDYAFAPFGELGDTHRVTASYKFGK